MLQRLGLIIVALILFSAADASAQVVIDSNITFTPDASRPGANYFGSIQQYPDQSYTGVWFNYTGCATFGCTLQAVTTLLDEGSDWYVVRAGDDFTKDAVHNGVFPTYLDKTVTTSPYPIRSIPIGDFYVGVRTGRGGGWYPGVPNFPDTWDIFGWVKLRNTGAQLEMISNVVAYGVQGIVIGTTQVVPEPSSLATGLLAFSAGAWLHRRHRRKSSQAE